MSGVIDRLIKSETKAIENSLDMLEYYFESLVCDENLVLKNFLTSYKPSNVISIMFADSDYESEEAAEILNQLGEKVLTDLLYKHSFYKNDQDIYHEHWNDLLTINLEEYESQIDIERCDENNDYIELLKLHADGYKSIQVSDEIISVFVICDIGIVRMKLDVEAFEKSLNKITKEAV